MFEKFWTKWSIIKWKKNDVLEKKKIGVLQCVKPEEENG